MGDPEVFPGHGSKIVHRIEPVAFVGFVCTYDSFGSVLSVFASCVNALASESLFCKGCLVRGGLQKWKIIELLSTSFWEQGSACSFQFVAFIVLPGQFIAAATLQHIACWIENCFRMFYPWCITHCLHVEVVEAEAGLEIHCGGWSNAI